MSNHRAAIDRRMFRCLRLEFGGLERVPGQNATFFVSSAADMPSRQRRIFPPGGAFECLSAAQLQIRIVQRFRLLAGERQLFGQLREVFDILMNEAVAQQAHFHPTLGVLDQAQLFGPAQVVDGRTG
ncbi:MAG: hypothetical protein ACK4Q4_01575 [Rhodocyclaceae bacterium]